MKPLNFDILKYFTKVDEACADDVIEALKPEYGNFRMLKKKSVIEALMTAEQNGLIEESRFDLDNNGDLRIFYHTTEESAATINNYIKD